MGGDLRSFLRRGQGITLEVNVDVLFGKQVSARIGYDSPAITIIFLNNNGYAEYEATVSSVTDSELMGPAFKKYCRSIRFN